MFWNEEKEPIAFDFMDDAEPISFHYKLQSGKFSEAAVRDEINALATSSLGWHHLVDNLGRNGVTKITVIDDPREFVGSPLGPAVQMLSGTTEMNQRVGGHVIIGLNPEFASYDALNQRYVTVAEQIVHGMAHRAKVESLFDYFSPEESNVIDWENSIFGPLGIPEKDPKKTRRERAEAGQAGIFYFNPFSNAQTPPTPLPRR